jgi:hypothetical protein
MVHRFGRGYQFKRRETGKARQALAGEIQKSQIPLMSDVKRLLEEVEQSLRQRREAARLAWRNSQNCTQALAESFPALDARLQRFVGGSRKRGTGQVHQLAPSAPQLAREAERSPEFIQLLSHLFDIGPVEDWESRTEWVQEISSRHPELSELLRRSGYYHAILANEPTRRYWEQVADRIPWTDREIRYLRLLDGCQFARDRFEIGGYSVVRMSESELESLGPPKAACDDFYPDESLDRDRLSRLWFIQDINNQGTGYLHEESSPGRVSRPSRLRVGNAQPIIDKEFAAGIKTYGPPESTKQSENWEVEFSSHLKPIFVLSLFDDAFFEIPLVLVSEPGWRIIHVSSAPFGRAKKYVVSDDVWPKFEAFIHLLEPALEKIQWQWDFVNGRKELQAWSWITIAALHYLRATFAFGKELPGWVPYCVLIEHPDELDDREPEQTLLQAARTEALLGYAFCLDALFGNLGGQQSSERVRLRAALVAGRDEREFESIRKLVKTAQDVRGFLVHGRIPKKGVDVIGLRRLCRRVLAVILSLMTDYEHVGSLELILRELPDSKDSQRQIEKARERICNLIADSL